MAGVAAQRAPAVRCSHPRNHRLPRQGPEHAPGMSCSTPAIVRIKKTGHHKATSFSDVDMVKNSSKQLIETIRNWHEILRDQDLAAEQSPK